MKAGDRVQATGGDGMHRGCYGVIDRIEEFRVYVLWDDEACTWVAESCLTLTEVPEVPETPKREMVVGSRVYNISPIGKHYQQTGVIEEILTGQSVSVRWDNDGLCTWTSLGAMELAATPADMKVQAAVEALKDGEMPKWLRELPAPSPARVTWTRTQNTAKELDRLLAKLGPALRAEAER